MKALSSLTAALVAVMAYIIQVLISLPDGTMSTLVAQYAFEFVPFPAVPVSLFTLLFCGFLAVNLLYLVVSWLYRRLGATTRKTLKTLVALIAILTLLWGIYQIASAAGIYITNLVWPAVRPVITCYVTLHSVVVAGVRPVVACYLALSSIVVATWHTLVFLCWAIKWLFFAIVTYGAIRLCWICTAKLAAWRQRVSIQYLVVWVKVSQDNYAVACAPQTAVTAAVVTSW